MNEQSDRTTPQKAEQRPFPRALVPKAEAGGNEETEQNPQGDVSIHEGHDRISREALEGSVLRDRKPFQHPAELCVPKALPQIDEGDLGQLPFWIEAIFPWGMRIAIFVAVRVMMLVYRTPGDNLPLSSHRTGDTAKVFHKALHFKRSVREIAVIPDSGAETGHHVTAEKEPSVEPVEAALPDLKGDSAE